MKANCTQQVTQAENAKTTLPKDLQIQMLKFFLKTSVPRKKREQMERERAQLEQSKPEQSKTISLSSETKSDGSEKK